MKNEHISSCIHEPKIVIKTFEVASTEKKYSLCKDCSLLEPFNEFLVKEEPVKEENFLSHGGN